MIQFIMIFGFTFLVIIFMLWLNTNHNPNIMNTNTASLVGKDGIVIEEINPIESTGQVKVSGETWSATCNGTSTITKNILIKVLEINGVKLLVEPKAN